MKNRLIGRGFVYLAAILIALWILIPIYLITMAAFSPREVIYNWPKALFPQVVSTETMRFFLGAHDVLPSFRRSIIVALMSLVLSLAIGAPAGYGLARYIFRGKDVYRIAILSTRAFPIVILSIPLAVTFMKWGMYDSLISVALLHVAMALPTTILVTSSVFMGISRELEEAATVFGCNRLQAFMRVALPLALPGLAASAIFTFVLSWNEVFAATILTIFNRTLPALLIVQLDAAPIAYRFAGGFFILIPAVVFMFFIRRYLFSLWGITLK
jgi:multiple sugar transport system permease protein